ncbi:hypothetical protein [Streptomyces sp. NBRC 110028]|uniref:hypothetical protein n=1 Tax=Streptomyces sp. NBRC 110028 TaxID=1621260 RepID=UPI001F32E765|nr:hypothetical protein [Streptomyces sp. NBRC 110028]
MVVSAEVVTTDRLDSAGSVTIASIGRIVGMLVPAVTSRPLMKVSPVTVWPKATVPTVWVTRGPLRRVAAGEDRPVERIALRREAGGTRAGAGVDGAAADARAVLDRDHDRLARRFDTAGADLGHHLAVASSVELIWSTTA